MNESKDLSAFISWNIYLDVNFYLNPFFKQSVILEYVIWWAEKYHSTYKTSSIALHGIKPQVIITHKYDIVTVTDHTFSTLCNIFRWFDNYINVKVILLKWTTNIHVHKISARERTNLNQVMLTRYNSPGTGKEFVRTLDLLWGLRIPISHD